MELVMQNVVPSFDSHTIPYKHLYCRKTINLDRLAIAPHFNVCLHTIRATDQGVKRFDGAQGQ